MSKKARKKANKAGKLMKCDGQMLKKIIEAKGYKLYELSRMLRYCSDYLTSCCRQNQISDVAAKYLMDYKIFPQMYDLEGEIKVEEPKEVKIDKDEKKDSPKEGPNHVFGPTAQEVKKVLNEKYGRLEKGVEGIDYGYGPAPKNPSYVDASQKIAEDERLHRLGKSLYQLLQAATDDLKHDPEFKDMIKQAVKEAYEEL